MNIRIKEYLEDLDQSDLPRRQGVFVEDSQRIRKLCMETDTAYHSHYLFDDLLMHVKGYKSKYNTYAIPELICGRVYNDLGVNSIIPYPMILENSKLSSNDIYTASQNLEDLENLTMCQAINARVIVNLYKLVASSFSDGQRDIWLILKNKDLKDYLLEHITEDCYNQLINLFLIDTLFTQSDRHIRNYFFFKSPNSNKWEGIVAIDNENLSINKHNNTLTSRLQSSSSLFERFLTRPTLYYVPQVVRVEGQYPYRLREINRLVDSGVFGEKQIELLKMVNEYDIGSQFDYVRNTYGLSANGIQEDLMKRLWEYNQNNLEL